MIDFWAPRPSNATSTYHHHYSKSSRVSVIFIFISGFSCNEKSDFEQLFEFQYVSAILFFRFYFYFVFYRSENCFFFIHNFFHTWQFTMPHRKSKRATTYHQCPNALSSLDIYTMMSYQCFQALCAISLVRSHRMLMLSMVLDEDDNDSLLLLYCHHLSLVHNNNFLFLLDSIFMNNAQ